MNYISTKEAAARWGITPTRVTVLACGGRIPGAERIGGNWMIPETAKKPVDGRTKSAREQPDRGFFRFPSYLNYSVESYIPPLSPEELQLRQAEFLGQECRLEEAEKKLGSLPDTAKNRYVRIAALFFRCVITMANPRTKFSLFRETYDCLLKEFEENFPHKPEMELLLHNIDALVGANRFYLEEFSLGAGYSYHESAWPMLVYSCVYALAARKEKVLPGEILPYELCCQKLEAEGCLSEAQSTHMYLGLAWLNIHDTVRAIPHFRRFLQIGYEKKLYHLPVSNYRYFAQIFDTLFEEFPQEYADRIRTLAAEGWENYVTFMEMSKLESIYTKLTHQDFLLAYYAMRDYPNKQVAELEEISESTVNSRYQELYQRLGLAGKKELKEYCLRSLGQSAPGGTCKED